MAATADDGVQDQPKTDIDPDDPTALFAKGLYGLFEPLVLELNDHIKNVFASQENLSAQLDHLTSELDRFNLTRAPPLDPHIERLQNLRKRMGTLSSHLDKVYTRLERMNRSYGNYRQQSSAPPLRSNQPSSQFRASESTASPSLMTTIYRPQDPMALPSPFRQLSNSDTPSNDGGLASPVNSNNIDDEPASGDNRADIFAAGEQSSASSSSSSNALQSVWMPEAAAAESTQPVVQQEQQDGNGDESANAEVVVSGEAQGEQTETEPVDAEPQAAESPAPVEQVEQHDEPEAQPLAPIEPVSDVEQVEQVEQHDEPEAQPLALIEPVSDVVEAEQPVVDDDVEEAVQHDNEAEEAEPAAAESTSQTPTDVEDAAVVSSSSSADTTEHEGSEQSLESPAASSTAEEETADPAEADS